MMEIVEQGILAHRREHGCFMPSVTRLSTGGYLGCQHVGTALGSPDNRLEVLCSDDGRDWELLTRIADPDPRWAWRCPDIEVTPNGELILTATRFENSGSALFDADTEALQRPENLLLRSTDGGATWSTPEVIPIDLPPERYTCNKAGRLVQFSSDRWMFPFETWKPAEFAGPPDQKAAAVFSSDQGKTWGDLTVVADDPTGKLLWWDQLNARLPDGRLYVMLWTHLHGTKSDLPVHWVVSDDEGRTWSQPQPTNLPGQVCCPIALPDGRVAAVYNHRQEPQGIRLALSSDLSHFDRENELVLFDAGAEARLGAAQSDSFLAEHLLIGFGKPQGIVDHDGTLHLCFWCTHGQVTHTRWVRVRLRI